MQGRHLMLLGLIAACLVTVTKADFGQAIVNEAIDLFSSQMGDGDDDPRSMEHLLHWAISHSDPEKLAAQAEEAQRIQMVKDLKEQRRRVKELLDHVRSQPTETDMMREGIAILQRAGASDTELLAALQALQVLVEPIDNANDLHPLGGIAAVVSQLTRGSSELVAAAAHVLGTAASNNPTFQRHLLSGHPDIVETLLLVSQSAQEEAAVKGVYALAALVRNTPEARRAFVDAGGFGALELLLRGEAVASRVKRKALSLFMDLADTQPAGEAAEPAAAGGSGSGSGSGSGPHIRTLHPLDTEVGSDGGDSSGGGSGGGSDPRVNGDGLAAAAISSTGLPKAVVALLLEQDADMQEKALLVLQRLAASAAARSVLRSSGADEAISRLHLQLQADAPEPGDEPDPYHDYLLGLVRQVQVLMAREDTGAKPEGAVGAPGCGEGGSGCGAGTDAGGAGVPGARSGEGHGGPAAGSSREGRGAAGSEQQQQQVLALGGPSVGRQDRGRVPGSGTVGGTGEGARSGEREQCGAAEAGQCALA